MMETTPAALHPPREGPCAATPNPLEAEHGAAGVSRAPYVLVHELDALVLVTQPSLARLVVGDGHHLLALRERVEGDGLLYSSRAAAALLAAGAFPASSCVHLRAGSSMIAALSMARLLMWAYVSAAAFSGATAARPCSRSPWRLDSPRLDVVRHLGTRGRCLGARPVIQPAAGLVVAGLRLVRTCWQTRRP